ncbi:hypothetical protein PEXP_000600 [Penicillium expansum]|nr:hypothetical protein PEXP_000600 [Penicillium expansum]
MSVSDLTIDLPCDEDLWACGDEQEWKQKLASKSSPRQLVKLVGLLCNKELKKNQLEPLGPSALFVATCTTYVEERALMKQFGGYSSHPIFEVQTETIFNRLNKQTDNLLDIFPQVYSTQHAISPIVGNTAKLGHLFQIIRFIPYRTIYSSCGWWMRKPEADMFTRQISRKLEEEPQKARQTLIHAAQLLHIVRTQQLPECFDSFLFLIASLYIWFYDRFVVARKRGEVAGPTHLHTLRIDRDSGHINLENWVNGGDEEEKLIHISGIGVLNGVAMMGPGGSIDTTILNDLHRSNTKHQPIKMAAVDYELIRNAIAQYSLAIDRKEYQNLAKGFTTDVVMRFPEPIGVLNGLPTVISAIERALENLTTHHALTTQTVKLTDEKTALATTYCMAMHFEIESQGERSVTGWGSYDDKLVKGIYDGKEDWRIVERTVYFHVPHTGDTSLLGLN